MKQLLNEIKIKYQKSKYDEELFNSCITLKNLAIVQADKPMSADYVYEQLMSNSKVLRPIYSTMLTLYRKGDEEKAFRVLTDNINTKQARNFSLILSKLDQINPVELIEQVILFQDAMSETRVTNNMKRTDISSIITTLLSTTTIFALLLNFTVIVVFMDSMSLIKNMF